jgi:hypothetical protein
MPFADGNKNILFVGSKGLGNFANKEFPESLSVMHNGNQEFLVKINNEMVLKSEFLERIPDLLPSEIIQGIVWFYDDEIIFELDLFLQNLIRKTKNLTFLIIIFHNKGLQDLAKENFEFISSKTENHLGQLSLSGNLSYNSNSKLTFDQIFNSESDGIISSSETGRLHFSYWGNVPSLDFDDLSAIRTFGDPTTPSYLNEEGDDGLLEYKRQIYKYKTYAQDLENQMKSIGALINVNDESTAQFNFRNLNSTKKVRLKTFLRSTLVHLFRLMPKILQIQIRNVRLKNQYLRRL